MAQRKYYVIAGLSLLLFLWAFSNQINKSTSPPDFDATEDLFQRVAQGMPSPHSPRRGFGLDLFVVQTYVDRLDGEVEATIHADGEGVVRCTLPAVSA